jgi:hypothetical protein
VQQREVSAKRSYGIKNASESALKLPVGGKVVLSAERQKVRLAVNDRYIADSGQNQKHWQPHW